MATGRPQPSVVIDVRTPSTDAASVATTEREMGYPHVSFAPRTPAIAFRRAMKSGCGLGGPLGSLWHCGAGGADATRRWAAILPREAVAPERR
jgi:hypothetical protein